MDKENEIHKHKIDINQPWKKAILQFEAFEVN